jgi:hypothetical protein
MPFINELIPEEDKAKIDWTKFKAWPFSKPLDPSKWTIDHESNVFLVRLAGRGPYGERPVTYALCWKGEVIRFEAEETGKGEFKTGVDMFWRIYNVGIPSYLREKQEKILSALKEAIDAHGSIYDREHVKSVHIEII